jgi:Lrp/AsnC family transcriptional regulator, regulator for asnA, asnC and gidA
MFDELDLFLIDALQKDARIPITQLARQLGQPIPTIRDRLKRLEKKGIIKGYTATIDLNKIGLSIKAIIQVRVSGVVTDPNIFLTELSQIPEVESAYLVTGDYEAVVILNVKNVEHLRSIIYERIPKVPGVSGTNTMLVLSESHSITHPKV